MTAITQFQNQLDAVLIATPCGTSHKDGSQSQRMDTYLRANRQRIDLTHRDPCNWTPRRSEAEDVDADESDEDFVGSIRVTIGHTNDGDNELQDHVSAPSSGRMVPTYLTNGHADSTVDKKGAAAKFLDGIERKRCGEHIDDVRNHRDQERVLDAD